MHMCMPHLYQPAQVLFLNCELLDNFGELLLNAKVVTRTGLSWGVPSLTQGLGRRPLLLRFLLFLDAQPKYYLRHQTSDTNNKHRPHHDESNHDISKVQVFSLWHMSEKGLKTLKPAHKSQYIFIVFCGRIHLYTIHWPKHIWNKVKLGTRWFIFTAGNLQY